MKILSPEVALYLYKSTTRPCVEHCCHVRAVVPSCYLELSDQPQKRIYRTVSSSLVTSLEPLVHRRNVANLSLFYRCYFGRCSSELTQLDPLPFSRRRSARKILINCQGFLCQQFLSSRSQNSLVIERFPLTYELNGFKYRINRHLLIADSF